MLARNLENKLCGFQPELNVGHNSAISAADCEPLIGAITPIDSATGNTSTQRMGDRIKPKSLRVKGVLALNPTYWDTQQPIYVRVVIATQKNVKVGSAVLSGSVDTARLLRPGYSGTGNDQIPFTGITSNLNEPINKDLFRVYCDKIIKLVPSFSSAGANEAIPQSVARWSYTFKKLPATLTFDEGNGDWANNFAPFVAMGYAFADGTAPETTKTRIISNVASFLEFEDA